MAKKPEIGEILVANSIITQEQRAKALKLAAQSKLLFGEAVVKLGFADDEAITMALSKQMGIPYASKENKILKVEKGQGLDKTVPEAYARENLVLPLFLDENVLAVAMADPSNMLTLDNLRLLTGLEIQPFIATKSQIFRAIDDFYQSGGSSLIDKAMGEESSDGVITTEEGVSEARLDLDKTLSGAKDEQVINLVNAILKQAITERCSDIHLESYGERTMTRFRIDGVLCERPSTTKQLFPSVVSRIKILSKLDIAERRLPQDGQFTIKVQNRAIDLRVSICPTINGEKVVMRILDRGAVELDIDKMGFEARQKEDFLAAARLPHGLIFLTGPTGSGKTTTLYTILNKIKTPELNFMTIEDPVEFQMEGFNQVQVRSAIGLTFASALRSFLRQDPDVILVGEVRDQETAQTCLRAALTGHLVLSTLHTNDAMSSVSRLADLGIEPFLLSSSLILVAAQRLVRVLCPFCRVPYKPSPKDLELPFREAMLGKNPDPASLTFYKQKGCEKCSWLGYKGRNGIFEVYFMTHEMREAIYKQGVNLELLRQLAAKAGMWNMRASGWRKVMAGITTVEEMISVTIGD